MFKKSLCFIISFTFFITTLVPVPKAQAQSLLGLPEPGAMVNLSAAYQPAILKGITVHKDNPFMFDFLVDVGQDNLAGDSLKNEGDKLIKYFMATLAVPEKDLWVNLSPYEKDRTVPEALGQTDMGRDLLAQDYILKQLTASLIYPEKELGKKFWDNVYQKTQAKYGNVNIPVNTFNKVWIMADKAEVFEHNQTAFVTASHLKVMLEEDYLAANKNNVQTRFIASQTTDRTTQNIIKEIILPELEHEINTGKNFANLRQIFNSIILASWYKNNLKQSLLNEAYSNKSTVKGIDIDDKTIKQQIYERYLQAYKKGVFNYIKETPEGAPKKYFSGGVLGSLKITKANEAMAAAAFNENNKLANFHVKFDAAMLNVAEIKALTNELLRVTVNNKNITLLNGLNSLGGNVMVSPDNEGGFYIILSVDWEKNVVNHDGAAATTPNPAFHPVNREKIDAAIDVFIKNFLKYHRDTYSIESLGFISPEVKPGQLRMDIHRIHITSPFTDASDAAMIVKNFDILVQVKTAVNSVLKGQRYFLDTQYSKDDVEQLINAYNGQASEANKVELLSEASDAQKTKVLYLSSVNDAFKAWVAQEINAIRVDYIKMLLISKDLQNVEDALFGVDGVKQVTEQTGLIVEDTKEKFLNVETGELLTAGQVVTQFKNYRWFVVELEGGENLNIVESRLVAQRPGIRSIEDAVGVQLKVRMGEGYIKLPDGLRSLGKVDVARKTGGGFLVTVIVDERAYKDPKKLSVEAIAAFLAHFIYDFRQYYTADVLWNEKPVVAKDGFKIAYQILIDPVPSNTDAAMKSVMVSKRDFQSFHEYLDKLLKKELQVESYKIAGETVVVIPVSFMPESIMRYMEEIAKKFNIRLQRLNNASYYFVPNRLRYFLGTTNGNAEYMGRKIAPLTKYLNALNAELTANINHKFNPPINLNGIRIDAAMSHYADSRQESLLSAEIANIQDIIGFEVQRTPLADGEKGYILSIPTPTREESKAVLDKLLAYATNEDVKNNYVIELLRVPQEVEFMGSKYFNVMFKLTLKTSSPEADKDGSNVISFNVNKTKADAAMNGGIDLKDAASNTNVRKEGLGVEFRVDQAMIERVRREGINSLTPVILSIDSSVNIGPLLGL